MQHPRSPTPLSASLSPEVDGRRGGMILRSSLARRPAQPRPPPEGCRRLLPPRPFHCSACRRDEHARLNHYETLEIEPNASPAEIKKQFYKLSKAHHPDLHPNDSTASQRFVQISEAYATLGSPDKRARYDRDFLRTQQAASPNRPSGSYSSASTTPFGGRPASGLSRRRTHFRGPPPSFYSSGGWGQHSEKRGEHASKPSHTHEAQGKAQSNNVGGGMGPGGFAEGYDNDVPHFDQRSHAQTHSNIERMRHRTRRKRDPNVEERESEGGGSSALFNFTWVTGMFAVIFWFSGQDQGYTKKQRSAEAI